MPGEVKSPELQAANQPYAERYTFFLWRCWTQFALLGFSILYTLIVLLPYFGHSIPLEYTLRGVPYCKDPNGLFPFNLGLFGGLFWSASIILTLFGCFIQFILLVIYVIVNRKEVFSSRWWMHILLTILCTAPFIIGLVHFRRIGKWLLD
ncbi:MAG: hypothetical protein E3J72_14905 [Planctomycetota bacterium]|nr:MAG: hypothetical protein E3J72_14905 [Planctomycetota bacterium]